MASKKKRNRSRPPSAGRRPPGSPSSPAARSAAARSQPKAGRPPSGGEAGREARGAPAAGPKEVSAATGGKAASGARGPSRTERLAQAQKARRRKAVRTRALVAGAAAAVVALIAVTVVSNRRAEQRLISRLEAGPCEYDTRTDSDRGAGRNHVNGDVSYQTDPPSGGDHAPAPSPPGVFTLESRPGDAQVVHSLEHGYVAIWHRTDLDDGSVAALRDLAGRYERDVLLVPRPTLERPVVATAWHRRLLCAQPDLAALDRFVVEFRNKGPEKVPR